MEKYSSKDIRKTIKTAASNVKVKTVENLIKSIDERLMKVIEYQQVQVNM